MTIAYVLEGKYRELYWLHNEYQIISTPAALVEAKKLEIEMCQIEGVLGYMPEP
jgi:hypothetical protein